VLGFLHSEQISAFYASDISDEALDLARQNLNLLTPEGLIARNAPQKADSISNLISLCRSTPYEVFKHDILNGRSPQSADIVICDVPYGDMVDWSSDGVSIDTMLNNIDAEVVAISSNKRQKIKSERFKRLEKFNVGKRRIEIRRKI